MKRLFTFAIVGMIASLAFAQTKVASKNVHQLEKVPSISTISTAKQAHAAQLEKANAELTTSTSVLRHKSATATNHNFPCVNGNPMGLSFSLRSLMDGTTNIMHAAPFKEVEQEGNVTVTKDVNGIITNVTGVEAKYYQRATSGVAYYVSNGSMYYDNQSGLVTIIEDGDNVYIKNPITRYSQGSWVKGVKSGNAIKVATWQPLAYNANYNATISLRWGVIDAEGNIAAADDHADAFTFAIDGDVLTLEGTESFLTAEGNAYYMGAFWDDDDSPTGYGDAETVLTYDPTYEAPNTELVELPAGAVIEDWYLNGKNVTSAGETKIKNKDVSVAIVGDEVYISGVFEQIPEPWFKGTIEGSTITFSNFQFLGVYGGSVDIFFIGYDEANSQIVAPTATYDAANQVINFNESILSNGATDRIYYLDWVRDAVISKEKPVVEEPIITDLTATLPYVNTFDTQAEVDEVAVYDANEDGSTFTIATDSKNGTPAARYQYNSSNNADDFLVFPGLPLEAGVSYKVSVEARAQSSYYPETFEVVCGKIAKASELNITVIPATVLEEAEYATYTNDGFTVAEDGTYFFAIHAVSDADQYYMWLDNFSVKANDVNTPVAITDLAVVPDATGANKATVTFTVPAKNIAGETIANDLDVTVKCDGQVIFEGAKTPGSAVSIESEVEAPGYYIYSATTANGAAVSDAASVKAWVGVDIPGAVENLTAADKNTAVALAWDAPSAGANGGVIIPSELTYNVYPVEMIEFWGMLFPETDYEHPYATGLTETNANVPFDTNVGPQGFTYFAVSAADAAGEGTDIYAALLTGAPFSLPVIETVANGSLDYWWGYSMDTNMGDDDGLYLGEDNSFEMYATGEGWITLQSGKIAVKGATNPVVAFDAYAENASTLDVIVLTANGETVVKTINTDAEYESYTVSLKDFANEEWVRVFFKGTFADADDLYINNLKIYNKVRYDLAAAGISAPSKVQAGDNINVAVSIVNQGESSVAQGKYLVDLYVNGNKEYTQSGPSIESWGKATIDFTIPTSAASPATMDIYAVIVFAQDMDADNNTTASMTVKVNIPNYPTVTDLEAEIVTDGVALTWDEPETEGGAPEATTDTFDDYDPFQINDAGDWTFVDVDGSGTYGFTGISFDNAYQPMAFIVFDQSVADGNLEGFAYSGNQAMACFAATDGENDDWMISPVLPGCAQNVKFMARSWTVEYGAEEFEILYSTTDNNIASFTSIAEYHDVPDVYTEYSFDLPEGAKYFAIRCISQDRFIFIVDDVTYIPAGGSAADLTIVGYNIYRNGEKINNEPVAETSYTDENGTAADKYSVSVVYTVGESAACPEVGVTTGIESAISGAAVKVQGHSIIVKAEGNVAIYSVDGKAIYADNGDATVAVAPGVYVVKYGNKTSKVVVK